jgi:hypothetical protein
MKTTMPIHSRTTSATTAKFFSWPIAKLPPMRVTDQL